MTLLLTDAEIRARLDAPAAVSAMRAAVFAAYQGRLVAPPRASAPLDGGRLVMTAGQLVDDWYGFRSYDTFGHPDGEQLVALHDARSGRLTAIAIGEEIGSRRVVDQDREALLVLVDEESFRGERVEACGRRDGSGEEAAVVELPEHGAVHHHLLGGSDREQVHDESADDE